MDSSQPTPPSPLKYELVDDEGKVVGENDGKTDVFLFTSEDRTPSFLQQREKKNRTMKKIKPNEHA